MSNICFDYNSTQKTRPQPRIDANGKMWLDAIPHTTLTAKTPYKIIMDEYGYLTAALTTAGIGYIGVPDAAYTTSQVAKMQIFGLVEDMITPSLSVAAGHAMYIDSGVVADKGADYTGVGTEFAICQTASTTSTTQDAFLTGRWIQDRIVLDSATTNTAGSILLAGTSSARIVLDTADTNFIQIYTDCGATTGTSRGMYLRNYITGAGGNGEALRVFTTIENVVGGTGGIHGAHISLNMGTTGSTTGLGVAMRATLQLANQAYTGLDGTYAAVQAELYSDGATTDPVGMTELSCIRCVLGGDSNGIADVDDDAYLIVLDGNTNGSGNIVSAVGNEPTWASATHKVRCKLGGTVIYLVGVLA